MPYVEELKKDIKDCEKLISSATSVRIKALLEEHLTKLQKEMNIGYLIITCLQNGDYARFCDLFADGLQGTAVIQDIQFGTFLGSGTNIHNFATRFHGFLKDNGFHDMEILNTVENEHRIAVETVLHFSGGHHYDEDHGKYAAGHMALAVSIVAEKAPKALGKFSQIRTYYTTTLIQGKNNKHPTQCYFDPDPALAEFVLSKLRVC